MISFPLRRMMQGSAGWWHPAAAFAVDMTGGRFMRRGVPAPLASVAALSRGSEHRMADAGGVFQAFGNNTLARTNGLGAFIGGSFTNKIRNPRFKGGTVGTFMPAQGGALPTNMAVSFNAASGLTYQYLGAGIEDGLPFADIRIFGNHAGAGASPDLIFETGTHAPFVQNDKCGNSCWIKLLAGVAPGTVAAVVYRYTATGAAIGGTAGTGVVPTDVRQFVKQVFVIPEANAAFASGAFRFGGFVANVAHDATYRIYTPNLIGPMQSAYIPAYPILPPVGAPADTLRAADDLGAASFDWFNAAGLADGFGVLGEIDLHHIGDGVDRVFIDFAGATGDERATLKLNAANSIEISTRKGGVLTVLATSAAVGAGVVRFAARIQDGSQRLAVAGQGGIGNAAVGVMPAGLDRMTIGHAFDGTAHLNDVLRSLQVTKPLNDAEIAAWLAG